MSSPAARSLLVLAATSGAGASYIADWHSPVRVAITAAFLLFVPGLAVCDLVRIEDSFQRLAVATGTSLGVETLVCVAFLYAGGFSAGRTFATVAALTAATACVSAVLSLRGRAAAA
jgi:hypothetical protein